jgi:hypothetical protein
MQKFILKHLWFPFWELEFQWTPKFLEGDSKGQNSLDWKKILYHWNFFYTIEKLLKRNCLKWAHMSHLNVKNTSYGQKKGHESKCQFDSRPLKVKNCLDLVVCRWRATYIWKALDKGYNFDLDLTSIEGLHKKLWTSKIAGVPISGILKISGLSTWESQDKMTFECNPCG